MLDLMEYEDDFELEGFDFDSNFEDDDYLGEADYGVGAAVLAGAAGAGIGGLVGGGIYDGGTALLKRWGYTGKSLPSWLRKSSIPRDVFVNVGAGAGGALGAALAAPTPTPESEYEAETIEDMEALMEIALEGDSEDAEEALDGMIMRAFGPIRTAANMRRIMAAIRAKVAQLVARARRDPRLRSAARAAPMVLRRTAVKLLRMVAAGRQVTVQIAMRVFAGELARVLQSSNRRAAAARAHRARALRSFARHRTQHRMRQPRAY